MCNLTVSTRDNTHEHTTTVKIVDTLSPLRISSHPWKPLSPGPPHPSDLPSVTVDQFAFLRILYNGIIQAVLFLLCLLSLVILEICWLQLVCIPSGKHFKLSSLTLFSVKGHRMFLEWSRCLSLFPPSFLGRSMLCDGQSESGDPWGWMLLTSRPKEEKHPIT